MLHPDCLGLNGAGENYASRDTLLIYEHLCPPTLDAGRVYTWAATQEGRYEFDGFQPVAMTGRTVNQAIITRNLHRALDARLRGSRCQPLGPDAGVTTIGNAIRYPDALVTCSGTLVGEALTVPGVVVLFEVLSLTTGRTDRFIKVRETRPLPRSDVMSFSNRPALA